MSAKFTPGPWIAQIPNIGEDPFERDERGNQYWEIKPVEMLFDGRYLDVTAWTSEANARLIAAANPAAISELLDRLEAAEKERDALRAKIEEMEKQEPVAEWLPLDSGEDTRRD